MSITSCTPEKVGFFVVGAQKSGTTVLDKYLRQHPGICMASRKEVHFFDNDNIFMSTHPDYRPYHSFFKLQPQHTICGESTPSYMYWLTAPKRIWEYNPEAKLIVILRNPIDRAFSHWNMQKLRGIEPRSFWDAIHSEREQCRKSLPLQNRRYSYIDRGFYSEQIRRLNFYFPDSKLLFLKIEELKESPRELMDKVWHFLSISTLNYIEPATMHALSYNPPMTARERKHLLWIFEYEIMQLERMLGWDCSDWRGDY